jgi:predicted RNase H-like HicB family nuclease/DNA-binding XRE family transcriptional regulator
MKYFAKIEKKGRRYLVSFPDLPGCNTYGRTKAEALDNASEALEGYLESTYDRSCNIPDPTEKKGKKYIPIKVPAQIAIPIIIRKARLKKHLSQQEMARKLEITFQTYQRIESLQRCNPTINTIERVSKALSMDLEITLLG